MRAPDHAAFCEELRALLVAGMNVVEAVETLAVCGTPGRGSALPRAVLQRLHAGQPLSAALAAQAGTPPVLVAAVQAGEHTSELAAALSEYLQFHELMRRLRQKVASAAIYPALVTALGLGTGVFLLLVVLPNFARMYEGVGGDVRGRAALVVAFAQVAAHHQADFVLALTVLGAAAASWWSGGGMRRLGAWLVQHIGFVRRRVTDFEWAVLHQAIALLMRGGYTLPAALRTATGSALSPLLARSAKDALERIEAGGEVSAAFHACGLCDEIDRRLMAAAERSGGFHRVMDSVARRHAQRFELFVDRSARMVEPLLLLGVALLVGGIVVAMYLPIFDLAVRLR